MSQTNSITFGSNHAIRKNLISKVSTNVPVDQVHETKFPGVILESKLSWTEHTNEIVVKSC